MKMQNEELHKLSCAPDIRMIKLKTMWNDV